MEVIICSLYPQLKFNHRQDPFFVNGPNPTSILLLLVSFVLFKIVSCFVCGAGAGLVKLQDDVQTCEYEDVQVMWEMLHKTETHVIDNRNKRPFWRVFLWSSSSSNHSSKASLQSSNHT
jgi:hypothetical protein